MLRTLLPFALIAAAGASYAQTMSTPATPTQPMTSPSQTYPGQPTSSSGQTAPRQTTSTPTMPDQPRMTSPTPNQTMPGSSPGSVDASGQPIIGRNDWVRQPGDRPASGTQSKMNADMAAAPTPARPRASGVGQPGPDGTFRDEYGFRYDAQGNRIDARGKIMPPPMSRQ